MKHRQDKAIIQRLREQIANQRRQILDQQTRIDLLERRLSTALDKEILLLNRLIAAEGD